MQRLFGTNINQTADALPRTVDAEIILTSVLYIMYKQFKLDDNFRKYPDRVWLSGYALRTGILSCRIPRFK